MHYGVLGMRWGIRKDRRKSGSSRKKSTEVSSLGQRLSSTASKASTAIKNQKKANAVKKAERDKARQKKTDEKTKDVKKMSDAELRKRIQRLQLEKTYVSLTSGNKEASSGKTYVKQILKQSGTNIANNVSNSVGQVLGNLIAEEMKRKRKS